MGIVWTKICSDCSCSRNGYGMIIVHIWCLVADSGQRPRVRLGFISSWISARLFINFWCVVVPRRSFWVRFSWFGPILLSQCFLCCEVSALGSLLVLRSCLVIWASHPLLYTSDNVLASGIGMASFVRYSCGQPCRMKYNNFVRKGRSFFCVGLFGHVPRFADDRHVALRGTMAFASRQIKLFGCARHNFSVWLHPPRRKTIWVTTDT